MFAALVALVAITQQPATAPEPAWYWSEFFGQRVQIYGRQLADGRLTYQPEDVGRFVAPAEMERRQGLLKPTGATPQGASLNYGILVDKLADDHRKIRASDPGTLERVQADLDEEDVGRKPGIFERAEMDVERAILYGVVACLAVASLVLVVKSSRSYPP